MRTVDYPLSRDAQGVVGNFALISLDPVASVGPLNDDTAINEASTLSPGRYLAFVKNYADFQWTEAGPRLTLHFTLCGRDLPLPPDAWAAIPISPAQPMEECTRPAVDPIVPMPWDNCYLYTLHFIAGNVSRIHLADEEHPPPRLSKDGQLYVLTAAFEDQRRQGLAERVRRAEQTQASVPRSDHDSPTQDEAAQDEYELDGPAQSHLHSQEHASSTDELQEEDIQDDGADEQALFAELFQQDDTPRMKLHFEVSFDFSEFSPDELSNPADLEAELVQLERIEWDWAQRTVADIMAKGPETSAWLAGIGDAEVPPISERIEVADDDELLMPEDAIEHRMERGEMPPVLSTMNITAQEEGSATRRAPRSASKTSSDDAGETDSQEPSEHTMEETKELSRSGSGGLSVFRLLSSIASFISRFRSFMWGLLWRKPFGRP